MPVGRHSLQMVSKLHRMFRQLTTVSSSCWVSSVGQSTIPWIPTVAQIIQYHNQHNDLAVAYPSLPTVVFHALPESPNHVSSFHKNWAGNPLRPTSTGNSHAQHLLFLQFAMRYAFLRHFFSCASLQFSSNGTISSIATSSLRPTAWRLLLTLRLVLD